MAAHTETITVEDLQVSFQEIVKTVNISSSECFESFELSEWLPQVCGERTPHILTLAN